MRKKRKEIAAHDSTKTKADSKATPHSHTGTDLFTSADLLAGSVLPIQLRLKVTIHPGSREIPQHGNDPAAVHLRRQQTLHSRLGRNGPKILAWARRSPKNGALFLTDPQAAAKEAGIKLPAGDLKAVMQHFNALSPGEVLPAGVSLREFEVNVVSAPYAAKTVRVRNDLGETKSPAGRKKTAKRRKS